MDSINLKQHNIMNIMRRFTLIELLVSTYCLYPRKLV